MGTPKPGYVFDMEWKRERERLTANEQYWDPFSIRILEQLGIAEGMRVLDVGAGGGTIAQWFARHVAPSGSVLAIDLDPRFIMALDEPNLEARQMDLFADEFPRDSFDVVHARCLLEHLPERVRGLERLIGAARPGGLVAVCDFGGELGGPVYPTPDDLVAPRSVLCGRQRGRLGSHLGTWRSPSACANSAWKKSMPNRSVVTWSAGTSAAFGSTSSL